MKHLSSVSRETVDKLTLYVQLLHLWNGRINLISRGDEALVWERHIEDSLQLLSLMPETTTDAVDVGSGAGFPGLVLAIASGVPFTLIESDVRKSAFLREAVRITNAPARVLAIRAEEANICASLVTARALASLPRLLDLCFPLLEPDGKLLFLKGAGVEAEIADVQGEWTMRIERHISVTGGGGMILRISEVERARHEH